MGKVTIITIIHERLNERGNTAARQQDGRAAGLSLSPAPPQQMTDNPQIAHQQRKRRQLQNVENAIRRAGNEPARRQSSLG